MAGISEPEFLAQVLALARLRGWRSIHVRPARTARGWRTAVQGDGVGFPDLLLLRSGKLVVAELKAGRGRPTAEQLAWMQAFEAAGAGVYVWTPASWAEIESVLL
jgi:hypothetical protein